MRASANLNYVYLILVKGKIESSVDNGNVIISALSLLVGQKVLIISRVWNGDGDENFFWCHYISSIAGEELAIHGDLSGSPFAAAHLQNTASSHENWVQIGNGAASHDISTHSCHISNLLAWKILNWSKTFNFYRIFFTSKPVEHFNDRLVDFGFGLSLGLDLFPEGGLQVRKGDGGAEFDSLAGNNLDACQFLHIVWLDDDGVVAVLELDLDANLGVTDDNAGGREFGFELQHLRHLRWPVPGHSFA